MGERQVGKNFAAIRHDHLARYRWASEIVSGTVYDAGCGIGYGCAILAEVADHVVGVDKSTDAIEYAKKHWARPRVQYFNEDLKAFHYLPKKADYITAFEILEHVAKPEDFLTSARSYCGTILASVPNEDAIPFSRERFPYHVRHYTESEFHTLLATCGWKVLSWYHQDGAYSDVASGRNHRARTIILKAVPL